LLTIYFYFLVNGDAESPPPLPERRPAAGSEASAPTSDPRSAFRSNPLPNGYEVKKTQQGQIYFVHVPTGESFEKCLALGARFLKNKIALRNCKSPA
jgi:hypothetical protein